MVKHRLNLDVEIECPHSPASPELTITAEEVLESLGRGGNYAVCVLGNMRKRTANMRILSAEFVHPGIGPAAKHPIEARMKDEAFGPPRPEPMLEGAEGLYIVFDGPPGHESGRFVEVEDHNGKSVNVSSKSLAAWRKRPDGLWSLGPFQKCERAGLLDIDELRFVDHHACVTGDCPHDAIHDCNQALIDELARIATLAGMLATDSVPNTEQESDNAAGS